MFKSNHGLEILKLGGNMNRNIGVIELSKSLKVNTNLQKLTLWTNQIKKDGIISLMESLKTNVSLQKFYIFEISSTKIEY